MENKNPFHFPYEFPECYRLCNDFPGLVYDKHGWCGITKPPSGFEPFRELSERNVSRAGV